MAKINRSKPGAAISEYLDRIQQNPDIVRQSLTNEQNNLAREYQAKVNAALKEPIPFESESGFGTQGVDFDLLEGGRIQGDLAFDKDYLNKRRDDYTSFGGDVLRSLGKIGTQLTVGVAAGVATLADIPSAIYHVAKGDFAENFEQNPVAKYLNQVTDNFEKLLTIQNGNGRASWLKWLGESSGSIASTASIMIPGMVLSKVGKGVGAIAGRAIGKFEEGLKFANKLDRVMSATASEASKRSAVLRIMRQHGANEAIVRQAANATTLDEAVTIANAFKHSNQFLSALETGAKISQKVEAAIATVGSRSVETLMEMNESMDQLRETYGYGLVKKLDLHRNGQLSLEEDIDLKLIYDIAYDQYLQKNGISRLDVERMSPEEFAAFNEALDYEAINIAENFEKYDTLKNRFGSVANSEINTVALKNMMLMLPEYFQFDKVYSLMRNTGIQSAKNGFTKFMADKGSKVLYIASSEGFEEGWQTSASLRAKDELIKQLDLPDHLYKDEIQKEIIDAAILGAIGGVAVGVGLPAAYQLKQRLSDRYKLKKASKEGKEIAEEKLSEDEEQAMTEAENVEVVDNEDVVDVNAEVIESTPVESSEETKTPEPVESPIVADNETEGVLAKKAEEAHKNIEKIELNEMSFSEIENQLPITQAISYLVSNLATNSNISNVEDILSKLDDIQSTYIDQNQDELTRKTFTELIDELKKDLPDKISKNVSEDENKSKTNYNALLLSVNEVFNKFINQNLEDDLIRIHQEQQIKSNDPVIVRNTKGLIGNPITSEQLQYNILKRLYKQKKYAKYKDVFESKLSQLTEQDRKLFEAVRSEIDIEPYITTLLNDIQVKSVIGNLIGQTGLTEQISETIQDLSVADVVAKKVVNNEQTTEDAKIDVQNSEMSEDSKKQELQDLEEYQKYKDSLIQVNDLVDRINNGLDIPNDVPNPILAKAILNSNIANKAELAYRFFKGNLAKYISDFYKGFKIDTGNKVLLDEIRKEKQKDADIYLADKLLNPQKLSDSDILDLLQGIKNPLMLNNKDVLAFFNENLTKNISKYKKSFLSLYFNMQEEVPSEIVKEIDSFINELNTNQITSSTNEAQELRDELDFKEPNNKPINQDQISDFKNIGEQIEIGGSKYGFISNGSEILIYDYSNSNIIPNNSFEAGAIVYLMPSTAISERSGIFNFIVDVFGEKKAVAFEETDKGINLYFTNLSSISKIEKETNNIIEENNDFSLDTQSPYKRFKNLFDSYIPKIKRSAVNPIQTNYRVNLGEDYTVYPIQKDPNTRGSVEVRLENNKTNQVEILRPEDIAQYFEDNNIDVSLLMNPKQDGLIIREFELVPSINAYSNPEIDVPSDNFNIEDLPADIRSYYEEIFSFWSNILNKGINKGNFQVGYYDEVYNSKDKNVKELADLINDRDIISINKFSEYLERFLSDGDKDAKLKALMEFPFNITYTDGKISSTVRVQNSYEVIDGKNIERINIRKELIKALWYKQNIDPNFEIVVNPISFSTQRVKSKNVTSPKTKISDVSKSLLDKSTTSIITYDKNSETGYSEYSPSTNETIPFSGFKNNQYFTTGHVFLNFNIENQKHSIEIQGRKLSEKEAVLSLISLLKNKDILKLYEASKSKPIKVHGIEITRSDIDSFNESLKDKSIVLDVDYTDFYDRLQDKSRTLLRKAKFGDISVLSNSVKRMTEQERKRRSIGSGQFVPIEIEYTDKGINLSYLPEGENQNPIIIENVQSNPKALLTNKRLFDILVASHIKVPLDLKYILEHPDDYSLDNLSYPDMTQKGKRMLFSTQVDFTYSFDIIEKEKTNSKNKVKTSKQQNGDPTIKAPTVVETKSIEQTNIEEEQKEVSCPNQSGGVSHQSKSKNTNISETRQARRNKLKNLNIRK
jgi:hypothetical protein